MRILGMCRQGVASEATVTRAGLARETGGAAHALQMIMKPPCHRTSSQERSRRLIRSLTALLARRQSITATMENLSHPSLASGPVRRPL